MLLVKFCQVIHKHRGLFVVVGRLLFRIKLPQADLAVAGLEVDRYRVYCHCGPWGMLDTVSGLLLLPLGGSVLKCRSLLLRYFLRQRRRGRLRLECNVLLQAAGYCFLDSHLENFFKLFKVLVYKALLAFKLDYTLLDIYRKPSFRITAQFAL